MATLVSGPITWPRVARAAALIAAWAWAIVAGGGGLGLLFIKGPWPLTNGWFALLSGLAACPLTAWAAQRYAHLRLSGWVQLGAALFFFLAGRLALALGMTPTPPTL